MAGKLFVYPGQAKVSVPTASVNASLPQAVGNNTTDPVTFDSVEWDTNAWITLGDDQYLTAQTPGLYSVVAAVEWTTTGGTGLRALAIDMPAPLSDALDRRPAQSGTNIAQTVTALIYLDRGQKIRVLARAGQSGQSVQLRRFQIIGITPEAVLA